MNSLAGTIAIAIGTVVAGGLLWQSLTARRPRRRRAETAKSLIPADPPTRGLSELTHSRPIPYAERGVASQRFPSMAAVFLDVGETYASETALRVEVPERPANDVVGYVDVTWAEYVATSKKFAKALIRLGFERFDAVVICGFNAPPWFYAHWGAILAGGVSTGVYTTSAGDACSFIVEDSKAVVAVVENLATAQKFLKVKQQSKTLRCIVVWGETVPGDSKDVISFADFLTTGEGVPDSAVIASVSRQRPQDAVSLIYTSGTTGYPKGVMASSDNFLFASASAHSTWKFNHRVEHMVSYLPCSHVAAQILDIALPLTLLYLEMIKERTNEKKKDREKNGERRTMVVYFARPDALRGSLPLTLRAVRPTFLFAVPRVWEKITDGLRTAMEGTGGGTKAALVRWARGVAGRCCERRQLGGDGVRPLGMAVAERVVLAAVKKRLGLDRCTKFITGAAPIGVDTLKFLASFGIEVLELYGMSESTGIGTCSTADCFLFGTCGAAYDGTEVKIDHVPSRDAAGEGEVCYRGRHVMLGYLHCPEKTAEAIDANGWLHSGDIGRLDETGMLRITGRIKELIITAGGENIAPVPIETELKRLVPSISNAVVIGDRRKYNVVLVTLKTRPDASGQPTDELTPEARAIDPAATTLMQAGLSSKWTEVLKKALQDYNKGSVCVSNAARLQKAAILPRELSLAHGELTDTLKLKRSAITSNYAALIDALYV